MTTLYERYLTTGNYVCNQLSVTGSDVIQGQAFTVGTTGENTSHHLTSLIIWARRVADPGDWTTSIYACDQEHKPTGSLLASKTLLEADLTTNANGLEVLIEFSSPVLLRKNNEYCWLVNAPASTASKNVILMGGGSASPCFNPLYPDGRALTSTDAGATWTVSAVRSLYFKEYGYGRASSLTVTGDMML